jgi:hypothetical protein
MPTHAEIAARLLRDAAGFFRTVGEQNKPLAVQMDENAAVFEQVAELLERDPDGEIAAEDGSHRSYADIATRQLRDAAGFFVTMGQHNEPLAGQMNEYAAVYEQVAELLERDPGGMLEAD